jgi:hypothetical protein
VLKGNGKAQVKGFKTRFSASVMLLGGLCIGCGKSGSTNDDMCTGVPVTDVIGQSGFVMPNPASTGLPNPASYTTNGDGTVTDNVTGLIWRGTVDPGSYTPTQAATYCANLGGGWRLPTRVELVSLVDFTIASPGPTINQTYFPNTPGAAFGTSSAYGASGGAWLVAFDSGLTSADFVPNAYKVRCVR